MAETLTEALERIAGGMEFRRFPAAGRRRRARSSGGNAALRPAAFRDAWREARADVARRGGAGD